MSTRQGDLVFAILKFVARDSPQTCDVEQLGSQQLPLELDRPPLESDLQTIIGVDSDEATTRVMTDDWELVLPEPDICEDCLEEEEAVPPVISDRLQCCLWTVTFGLSKQSIWRSAPGRRALLNFSVRGTLLSTL